MRTNLIRRVSAIILGALLVMMTGCAGSPSSKFYQLSSMRGQTEVARDAASDQSLIVSIGPVLIPDYLDRPQIVTRSGRNELKLSEFDRWTGSLESDVNRVLVENVSDLLPANRFFVVHWTPYLESQVTPSYKVEVRIERFEGSIEASVLLRARWAILAKDKRLLLKRESKISEQVKGSSYDALVATMSNVLERLSREIADEIVSLTQKGG